MQFSEPEAEPHAPSPLMTSVDVTPNRTFNFHALQRNIVKQDWITKGSENGFEWPICRSTLLNVVLCPVDNAEGTVLVCTSGDKLTEAQTRVTCQMLHSLGWRPHVITGIAREAMPPKKWKIGCRATFAWYAALMPQILACAGALGKDECLMVAEDSCWPSDSLTPQRVHDELQKRGKALWLAALLRPKTNTHRVGATDVSARAVAGSKCFCGDSAFWRDVNTLFNATDKNHTTDSIFQIMVGLGKLDLVHPFLGATLPHVSMRAANVHSHNLASSDIDGKLLQLPHDFEQHLKHTMQIT